MRNVVLLLFVVASGCAVAPCPSPPQGPVPPEPFARIASEAVREASGLVASRRHPGVYWTHNDSGDRARVFAIGLDGRVRGEFQVEGARNVDWEDIATDDAGNLYLADCGNNLNVRKDLVVYRVAEPDDVESGGILRVQSRHAFRYADQKVFPDMACFNFDAEGLFWMEGDLWILTKHRTTRGTRLYRLPLGEGDEGMALEPVMGFALGVEGSETSVVEGAAPIPGEMWLPGTVTAADYDPGRGLLAALTYTDIHLFERTAGEAFPFRPVATIPIREHGFAQVEGLAFDRHGLVLVNEPGWLFRVRGQALPPPFRDTAPPDPAPSPAGSSR